MQNLIQSLIPTEQPAATNVFIVGYIAGLPVTFLIDSGAEVNTIDAKTFKLITNNEQLNSMIYSVTTGSEKQLKAYASEGEINVIATFVAELFISDDRPKFMETFYVINNARPLLSRSTAMRYSVLQVGLNVPILKEPRGTTVFPGEIYEVSCSQEFPKFNIPPVELSYNKSMQPSRNVYTMIPPAFKEETTRRLKQLVQSGIIEEVSETMDKSFCSSLLVVPKGKNDIRLVVDLRGPNKCIRRTPFRMPTLEAILTELNGACWFSTIDLTSAFFHVVLHENSRHLTNFFAGDAMYRFKRLPFGLTNAPEATKSSSSKIFLCEKTLLIYIFVLKVHFPKSGQDHKATGTGEIRPFLLDE